MQVRYYSVKTIDGIIVRITEKKLTARDSRGRFQGMGRGYCRWYGLCPFTTKGL